MSEENHEASPKSKPWTRAENRRQRIGASEAREVATGILAKHGLKATKETQRREKRGAKLPPDKRPKFLKRIHTSEIKKINE